MTTMTTSIFSDRKQSVRWADMSDDEADETLHEIATLREETVRRTDVISSDESDNEQDDAPAIRQKQALDLASMIPNDVPVIQHKHTISLSSMVSTHDGKRPSIFIEGPGPWGTGNYNDNIYGHDVIPQLMYTKSDWDAFYSKKMSDRELYHTMCRFRNAWKKMLHKNKKFHDAKLRPTGIHML